MFAAVRMKFEESDLQKLVTVSGFTEEACISSLNKAKENINVVEQRVNFHKENIDGHKYRGFTILGKTNSTEIDFFKEKRPVWFFFTGYGGFWPGMGTQFMRIKAFRNSIHRCAEVLEPEGIDLVKLIFNSTKETFDDVMNTVTIIVATQIALVDIYNSLNIRPDGMVGASAGEIACAYADGCLTLEETMLTGYWMGKVMNETVLFPCSKARIPVSWETIVKSCPADVYLSNSYNGRYLQVTGPTNSIKKFVEDLNSKQIKAMSMDFPLPFHTKYLSEAGKILKRKLEKVIANPKERSPKWLSTSVPESEWGTLASKLCNADYFVNNITKPVLLHETTKHIPSNAVTVQVNLDIRQWQEKSFKNLVPGHTGLHTNVNDLLRNIGKLYNAGAEPDVSKLYPIVNNSKTLVRENTSLSSVRQYHTGSLFNILKRKNSCPSAPITASRFIKFMFKKH